MYIVPHIPRLTVGRSQPRISLVDAKRSLAYVDLDDNDIGLEGAEHLADVLRYDNRTLKRLELRQNPDISRELMEKMARLVQINSESMNCSALEVGRKKRAEFGPTIDEIYSFIRSKPYILSD